MEACFSHLNRAVARQETVLRVPFATLLKIALAVLLVAVVVKLWPVILMIVIAVLIAVMLDPVVVWLERHRTRRAFAVTGVAVVVFGAVAAFFIFLVPAMTREVSEGAKRWPQISQRIVHSIPAARSMTNGVAGILSAGKVAVTGLTAFLFVLVVAIYLLVEGRRAFAWLVTFAPKRHRRRIERTARETSGVVLAFMRGNVITSIICAVYVGILMTALRIPAPLLLAVIAFIFDFVPVVGTIAMIVPAALLALTVSPARSLIVIAAYLVYHLVENYVIIPRVYGSQMRLSTLTVLLAIAAGGTLLGVIGAVLALPVAAAYPIIERIWLREQLPPDTVERHEELELNAR